ncbi:MAG: Uma2 family endonuclease [Pyrinomonadaceae bacterium]|nr:Uma2 family endonuclease [Pyrinomonadaceae bacterium]
MAQEIKTEPLPVPVSSPPSAKMTYEEFLAWADEDTWAEWVDGEVIYMSPVSDLHQDLADFLTALLRFFTETYQLGVIRSAPFQMKIGPKLSGREPDVLFISSEHLDRLKKTFLDGPADLVIEIVSPESRARDRGDKFYEYEQGGVREYWLLDPLRKQAEFYQLGEDGIYHLATITQDGIYRSVVLKGLEMKVDWLWQEPLPSLLSVLKEWRLV